MSKLRSLRERHEPPLTQEALARESGVTLGTIRRIERVGSANSATLRKVARALGVTIDDLLEEAS